MGDMADEALDRMADEAEDGWDLGDEPQGEESDPSTDAAPISGWRSTTPTCPECEAVMVIRTARKTGSQFWGCPKFPHCHGTRKLDGAAYKRRGANRGQDVQEGSVPASEIKEGCCFRKLTGEYVYLRISDAAVGFHGFRLGPDQVYGVCYNGNITNVDLDTPVFPMPFSAMHDNRQQISDIEEAIGCEGQSFPDTPPTTPARKRRRRSSWGSEEKAPEQPHNPNSNHGPDDPGAYAPGDEDGQLGDPLDFGDS